MRDSFRIETIASRYTSVKAFTTGFDYLRIILAVAIVIQHSFVVCYGSAFGAQMWASYARPVLAALLPMFFALSGFLVAGSLLKSRSLVAFLVLRVARIVPALTVEILLSVLIIGPLFTRLPLAEYFSSRLTWGYMANLVGWIHYILPGVFNELPFVNVVNASLWTIPFEFECYAALSILYLTGAVRKRWAVLAIAFAASCAGTMAAFWTWDAGLAASPPIARALVVAFLVGVSLSLYSDKIVLRPSYAALSAILLLAANMDYRLIYVSVWFAAYLCIYLGMTHFPKRGILFSGDYSYGLYLFAFPIQQALVELFPQHRTWYFNAIAALTLGFAYAAMSWWFVEKPVLKRKQVLVGFFDTIAARTRRLARLA